MSSVTSWRRPGSWISSAALAAALSLVVFLPTPHNAGPWLGALAGAALLGLLWFAARDDGSLVLPRGFGLVSWGLLAACALFQFQALFRLPIDAEYADMLPLVRDALGSMASGMNPYRVYHYPWPLPLTFLPGLWLSYVPAYALGWDLRWLGWGLGVVLLSRIDGGGLRGVLLLTVLTLSSKFTEFSRIGHLSIYWMLLSLFAEDYRRGSRRHILWLGLLLATRQTSWLLLPLVMRWQAVVLSAVVIAPFFLWDPSAFLMGTFAWYGRLGGYLYDFDRISVTGQLGFAGLFYELGLQALLPALLVCGWLALKPWRRGPVAGGALTLAVFALGTAPCWWYSLLDSFFLLAGPPPELRRRLPALGLAACVCGVWLGFGLPESRDLQFESSARLLEGFDRPEFGGERSFAWALAPRARLALPRLHPFHGRILLEARAPRPTRVELELNGWRLGSISVGMRWSVQSVEVPPGLFVVGNNSLIFRGKAPVRVESDPRPLMLALDRLILEEGVD